MYPRPAVPSSLSFHRVLSILVSVLVRSLFVIPNYSGVFLAFIALRPFHLVVPSFLLFTAFIRRDSSVLWAPLSAISLLFRLRCVRPLSFNCFINSLFYSPSLHCIPCLYPSWFNRSACSLPIYSILPTLTLPHSFGPRCFLFHSTFPPFMIPCPFISRVPCSIVIPPFLCSPLH